MFRRLSLFFLAIPALAACGGGDLHLKIRFREVPGLGTGDRVYFEARAVGEVREILLEKSGSHVVHVVIRKEVAPLATEHARFLVGEDPLRAKRMALRIVTGPQGGAALKDGATMEGSAKGSTLAEGGAADLEERVERLKRWVEDLAEELKRIPRTEAFRKFERELRQFADEMRRSGDQALERFEKDVLPRFEEGLNRFKEWLEREFGNEKEEGPHKVRKPETTRT